MSTSPSLPNGPAAGAQIAETEFSIELPEHGTVAARPVHEALGTWAVHHVVSQGTGFQHAGVYRYSSTA